MWVVLREIGLGGDAWSWLKFMTRDSLRNKRCLTFRLCCKGVSYTPWAAYFFSEFNFEIRPYFELK
jgi:hypothetical protein